MIALALAAALITQAYGGQLDILRGLDDHECAEARCIALWGETCGAHEKTIADRPIECRDLPGSCTEFYIGGRRTYWYNALPGSCTELNIEGRRFYWLNGAVRPGDARPALPTCKLNQVCDMTGQWPEFRGDDPVSTGCDFAGLCFHQGAGPVVGVQVFRDPTDTKTAECVK